MGTNVPLPATGEEVDLSDPAKAVMTLLAVTAGIVFLLTIVGVARPVSRTVSGLVTRNTPVPNDNADRQGLQIMGEA